MLRRAPAPASRCFASLASSKPTIDAIFGSLQFGKEAQERFVSAPALAAIQKAVIAGEPVDIAHADAYARGLLAWSKTLGVRCVADPVLRAVCVRRGRSRRRLCCVVGNVACASVRAKPRVRPRNRRGAPCL
jgi:hypothetical protein